MEKKEITKELIKRIELLREKYPFFVELIPSVYDLLVDDNILFIHILDYLQAVKEPEEIKCKICKCATKGCNNIINSSNYCEQCNKLWES